MTSEQSSLARGRMVIDGDYALVRCGRCYGELEFHQPDPEAPYKILGTCEHCEAWYLMNLLSGWMLLLPDGRA
jgi:hypothetical protein